MLKKCQNTSKLHLDTKEENDLHIQSMHITSLQAEVVEYMQKSLKNAYQPL